MLTFTLPPPSDTLLFTLLAFMLGFGVLSSVLVLLAVSPRSIRYHLSEQGLHIRALLYGRRIAYSELDLSRSEVVDLTRRAELQPAPFGRGFGLSVPGAKIGRYRLRGQTSALVFLTDRQRVLYLARTALPPILLSSPDPEALLDALRHQRALAQQMPPPGSAGMLLTLLLALGLDLIGVAPLLLIFIRPGLVVDDHTVSLTGILYHAQVPTSQIEVEHVRRVDLTRESVFTPKLRTNGLDLFGQYREGHHTLKNGRKAMVVLSKKEPVLYIPFAGDRALLFSPDDPQGLLDALQRSQRPH